MAHKVWFHIWLICGCILDTYKQPFSYHDSHSTSNVLWLNNSSCLNQLYYIAGSVPLGSTPFRYFWENLQEKKPVTWRIKQKWASAISRSRWVAARLEGLYVFGVWPIAVLRPYKLTNTDTIGAKCEYKQNRQRHHIFHEISTCSFSRIRIQSKKATDP